MEEININVFEINSGSNRIEEIKQKREKDIEGMERNIFENVKTIKQSISTEEEATREEDIIIKEIFLNLEQVIAIQREEEKTNLQTIFGQISMDTMQFKETLNSNIEVILTGLDTASGHLKEFIEDLSNTLRPNRL